MSTHREPSNTSDMIAGDNTDEKSVYARIEDLHLHFNTERGTVRALNGVTIDIHEAETFALVGETGCGKTITARSFMQLVPTPPGEYKNGQALVRSDEVCVECYGEGCLECYETGFHFTDVLTKSEREMQNLRGSQIAMVFQDPETALNPSLTIREHVAEAILAHRGDEVLERAGITREEIGGTFYQVLRKYSSTQQSKLVSVLTEIPPLRKHKAEIDDMLEKIIIEILEDTRIPNPDEVIDKYPHELSGGMKQRVMISMALVAQPNLLIADEPTTALDVTTQVRILEMMDDLQEKYNTSLLYITHDLSLVRQIADRVGVMYAGQIAEVGDVEDVYSNPLHPYTQGLLDSIPREEKLDEQLEGISGSIPDLTNPPNGCRFCTRCPEVMDHCSEEQPALIEKEPDHQVACHLYTDNE